MSTTNLTAAKFFLIESSGETRQVWGPYASLAAAKKQAGKRHAVVTGDGIEGGQSMTRGALRNALESGRIIVADGSDKWALA